MSSLQINTDNFCFLKLTIFVGKRQFLSVLVLPKKIEYPHEIEKIALKSNNSEINKQMDSNMACSLLNKHFKYVFSFRC
ncbi:MAG: hypothetical protein DRI57_24420 [Deltaproteobacteria bacterium]|nr:MAG: hypothetical protein DRI57_24420 [Deltaproteobacteria bacterium]